MVRRAHHKGKLVRNRVLPLASSLVLGFYLAKNHPFFEREEGPLRDGGPRKPGVELSYQVGARPSLTWLKNIIWQGSALGGSAKKTLRFGR